MDELAAGDVKIKPKAHGRRTRVGADVIAGNETLSTIAAHALEVVQEERLCSRTHSFSSKRRRWTAS